MIFADYMFCQVEYTYIGALWEIKKLTDFLNQHKTKKPISEFWIPQQVQWQFIPENA